MTVPSGKSLWLCSNILAMQRHKVRQRSIGLQFDPAVPQRRLSGILAGQLVPGQFGRQIAQANMVGMDGNRGFWLLECPQVGNAGVYMIHREGTALGCSEDILIAGVELAEVVKNACPVYRGFEAAVWTRVVSKRSLHFVAR
jgi:hypothetical protein